MKDFLRFLSDCVFPRRCLSCDELSGGSLLCGRCVQMLRLSPGAAPLVEGGTTVFVHSPFLTCETLLSVVRFLKFEGGTVAVGWLGRMMSATLLEAGCVFRDPLLVPVPLHWSRRARRGYDQAKLLAAEVARITGIPSTGRAIARRRKTRPQSKLSREHRDGNVAGAFRAGRAGRLRGRDIILIDDIVTTGATVLACREALAPASPASFSVLCAGRAGGLKNMVERADSHMFE